MKKTVFLLVILPLSLSLAYAADTEIKLKPEMEQQQHDAALSCTLIKDNAARLACFDKSYATQFPPKQPIQAAAAPPKSIDLAQTYQSHQNGEPKIVFASETPSADLSDPTDAYTPLSQLYDLDKNNESGIFSIREHEPMYLLPAWYRSGPNYYPSSPTRAAVANDVQMEQKHIEAKMQVSFKTKVMEDLFNTRADLWAAYTQQSNWQVYNQGRKSAPFRNSDYLPEIFITQPVKANLPWGGKLRMVSAGYLHESNGQSRPLSRSWNRIYAMAGMEWGKLSVIPRIWTRIDSGGNSNDNPDIMDYMGYGDIRFAYQFPHNQTLSSTLRYNPFKGKGAIQLNYTFPIKGKLKGYVQAFHGYGESLLDYNHKQSAIGLGITFNGWDAL